MATEIGIPNTDIPSSSVAQPILTAIPSVPVNHGEKPEKFDGANFKRWQQKMLFYLTTLGLAEFLREDAPVVAEDEQDRQRLIAVQFWKDRDFLCRNYILNGLSDAFYSVYTVKKTARELWESLERKYRTEDAGVKKFAVSRFLDFRMVDSKTVMSQVHEIQLIVHEILADGMMVCEPFQVAAVISKLPTGWKGYKQYLLHKKKPMSMEDLIYKLHVEEDSRKAEEDSKKVDRDAWYTHQAKANMVDYGQSSGTRRHQSGKQKKKEVNMGPKGGIGKKPKYQFHGKCYNCDKVGHRASECRKPLNSRAQAHVAELEELAKEVSDLDLSA